MEELGCSDPPTLLGSGNLANVYSGMIGGIPAAIKVPTSKTKDLSKLERKIKREVAIYQHLSPLQASD
jgi:hypothetical protein